MLGKNKKYQECIDLMVSKKIDPYEAAEQLAEKMLG
jgi:hypothetical protein